MCKRKIAVLFITLAFLFAPALPATTTQSNTATIALTATVPSQLTVSVSQSSLNVTNVASSPINVTTSWNLQSGIYTQINTAVYFNSAVALSSPSTGGSIPTSAFICINPSGSGSAANAQVVGGITFPNTCAFDFSVNLTSSNLSGTATVPYQFTVPALMTYPPASDYSGTLNITAVAF
jgi:hypothetical protein